MGGRMYGWNVGEYSSTSPFLHKTYENIKSVTPLFIIEPFINFSKRLVMRLLYFFVCAIIAISTHAQKQDIILNHQESFYGGTTNVRWQYNNQFSYEYQGAPYALIKAPSKAVSDFEFPLPAFNNANDRLGKDFILSIKVGNGQPRIASDTGIFVGVNIELAKGYSIGFSVNGINKFQTIGLGDKYMPMHLTGKYSGHKPLGDLAFSLLKIQKKQDSLIFSVNEKIVLRSRILLLDSSYAALNSPSELCYQRSAFYASSNKGLFSSSNSFVIDDFTLVWLARKGDELLAEELLNNALQKYTFYSKPYYGKYIIAKTMDDKRCVLNLYGNYIIPPTTDPIRITSQPGIFIKEDGAREELYNDKGEYEEFGAAKTKALLASQKEPEFLQSQPLLSPLALRHYNSKIPSMDNSYSYLPFMRTVGIIKEENKKGLRSSSGKIYYHPGFDEIWIQQVKGVDNMYSRWESDYCIMAKLNGNTIQLGLGETNPDKLFRKSSTTTCKACHGKGGYIYSGFAKGDYVPAEYKSYEHSYNYTNVYGQKWHKTYSGSIKVAEGYYEKGKAITKVVQCATCNNKGYIAKKSVYLVWNATKKEYEEKIETER